MERRSFLVGVGATLALAGCSGTPRSTTPRRDPRAGKIVVVGAGLSGLTVAYRLMQHGYDVMVIEATARPGGRIRTIRGWPDGLYVEAGATHLLADPDLVALIRELGVPVGAPAPRAKLARVSHLGGERRVAAEEPARAYTNDEAKLGPRGRFAAYFGIVAQIDAHMLRSMQWSADVAKLDRMTCADYLRGLGASPAFIADIDDMMPIGDGVESISALEVARVLAAIDHERRLPPPPVPSNGRFAGGSDAFPAALARRLGDRVVYDTVLEHIDRGGEAIALAVRDRSGRHRIEAARVVLTMPFTVLRTIDVTPAWSPLKARAIAELAMTSVTRVWVTSDRRVWLDRGEAGTAETDLASGRIRDETELQPGTAGVLGIYASGAAGHRFAALAPAARVAALADDVARVHPGAKLGRGDSIAWENEPFARGAYAAFRPGQLTELAPAAAAPEGAIHFAGCGTSYRPGFMHGALASARRVVDEVYAATLCDAYRCSRP
jgi:monoamine oxidase